MDNLVWQRNYVVSGERIRCYLNCWHITRPLRRHVVVRLAGVVGLSAATPRWFQQQQTSYPSRSSTPQPSAIVAPRRRQELTRATIAWGVSSAGPESDFCIAVSGSGIQRLDHHYVRQNHDEGFAAITNLPRVRSV